MPIRSKNGRSRPMHSMRSQTLAAQSTTRACFMTIFDRSSKNVLRLRTTMSKGCRHGACCSSMRAAVSLSLSISSKKMSSTRADCSAIFVVTSGQFKDEFVTAGGVPLLEVSTSAIACLLE
ncbi:uncharacterized protein LOC131247327 [Magnolia sinica]|uniref:uncharacterized protein LOC131247327 n=1 Tax=Magnolia sinica TaxID=86752 RepID=UPI002658B322|nr:uncharacterized protein LOC131247327 [Magnolia sinica]